MLMAWVIIGTAIYIITRHELDELYDGEMAQIAHVLLGIYSDQQLSPGDEPRVSSSPFEGGENYEHKLAFQIWTDEDTLLLRSSNAPLHGLASQIEVFQTNTLYGNRVRTLAIPSPDGKLIIHVAQNLDIRQDNASDILELLILVLVLAFPLLMWLISRGINQGTQSLNRLSETIAHRTEHDLAAIETADVPTEIQDIIQALNKLMARVKQALGRERQFISDAAHELRTPLSGIKAHAQLAIKDESRRLSSLQRIVEGVDRTTRLANQLLTLSGIDVIDTLDDNRPVELQALTRTVIEDLSTSIEEKSIQLSNEMNVSHRITGNEDLLYILLRNLIDNAIRYSEPNGAVRIHMATTDDTLSLIIDDQGPGISEENYQRVFDRFYRELKQGSDGAGLGLAIAMKIAQLHKAEIQLMPGPHNTGLSARIVFRLISVE